MPISFSSACASFIIKLTQDISYVLSEMFLIILIWLISDYFDDYCNYDRVAPYWHHQWCRSADNKEDMELEVILDEAHYFQSQL